MSVRSEVWHSSGWGQPLSCPECVLPLASGCFLRLVTFTPLLSTLGAPLPTPRALGGGSLLPRALSQQLWSSWGPWTLSSVSLTPGVPWAPPGPLPAPASCRLSQDRRGTLRIDVGRSGPLSCCPLRDDAPWVTNAQSLESRCFMWLVCWWFCSWWFLMGR